MVTNSKKHLRIVHDKTVKLCWPEASILFVLEDIAVAFALLESIGNFLESNKSGVDSIDSPHLSFVHHSTAPYQSFTLVHLTVHIALRDALAS